MPRDHSVWFFLFKQHNNNLNSTVFIGLVWCLGQKKRIAPLPISSIDVVKATKGLTAFTSEIDYDMTPMGLSPVTSAVFI
jgi:hypothetical protein